MAKDYNELTRVQLPAMVHLCRLGYRYLSLKSASWDKSTNIFTDIFYQALRTLNPQLSDDAISRELQDLSLLLKNEDLGKAFYERLTQSNEIKLIDFENPDNNQYHCVVELTYGEKYNGQESDKAFRPDITLLINGLPLVFLEVKKPNNKDGLKAEFDRMQKRCQNPLFRPFINITQLMLFSNNQEYLAHDPNKTQGVFYASTGVNGVLFNYFRDEQEIESERYSTLNQSLIPFSKIEPQTDRLLTDFNAQILKAKAEFQTNCQPNTPTNRVCTALLSRERLLFLLKYGLAYVKDPAKPIEKHIMRYPQFFAINAIARHLQAGERKGIVWHTQGSGKTALAYYSVKYLTDFYQKQQIIPKFYFIVDRLDLRNQAMREFSHRGLAVNSINSREAFMQEMQKAAAVSNHQGKAEITVVNIHKFQAEIGLQSKDYDLSVQRIFFIDEAHRSFGNQALHVNQFLANLIAADPNAIHIGLTGTPLLGNSKSRVGSTAIFGNYIHKYYYNQSIADGYTLRLIREDIQSNYKEALSKILAQNEVKQGSIKKNEPTSRRNFVEPMLDYIVQDFEAFRKRQQDEKLGAMVICDSSEQARMMQYLFNQKYAKNPQNLTAWRQEFAANDPELWQANQQVAEPQGTYRTDSVQSASLILSDEGNNTYREELVSDFKNGKTDILFVYNMLLTGFDAKHLKKLYLGRLLKEHNLLQALTRVNRAYKHYEYGYVVDFADIQAEFDKTNAAYQKELNRELGDESEFYSQLFKSQEEIDHDIALIKETLFDFEIDNAEIFRQQIDQLGIDDKAQLLKLQNALALARSLYHQLQIDDKTGLQALDFEQLNRLYRQVQERLVRINALMRAEEGDIQGLLNEALESVYFEFHKVGEAELKLADELQTKLRKVRESLARNIDQKDPVYISLLDELKRLFEKKNIQDISQKEMTSHIQLLNKWEQQANKLNAENERLAQKFNGDEKYVRIFKRALTFDLGQHKSSLMAGLQAIKQANDYLILNQGQALFSNRSYFEKESLREIAKLKSEYHLPLNPNTMRELNSIVIEEYLA